MCMEDNVCFSRLDHRDNTDVKQYLQKILKGLPSFSGSKPMTWKAGDRSCPSIIGRTTTLLLLILSPLG